LKIRLHLWFQNHTTGIARDFEFSKHLNAVVCDFGYSDFEFVSDFVPRASDLP
jgi:hypothetical protein